MTAKKPAATDVKPSTESKAKTAPAHAVAGAKAAAPKGAGDRSAGTKAAASGMTGKAVGPVESKTAVKAAKGAKPEARSVKAEAKTSAKPAGKAAPKVDPKAEPKAGKKGIEPKKATVVDEVDLTDIEADLEGEIDIEVEAEAETVETVETVAEGDKVEKAKPLRMKVSRAKERALMREFGLEETTLTEEEATKRRQELKTLIKMGKTRGFLTHQEINDHLPEKLINEEILEAIISMLNDMGIAVYEQAPDAATLLVAGGGATTATEEEAEEAAEAALSTVDSEFGRTTDPVRMYMREMGTVELLTR